MKFCGEIQYMTDEGMVHSDICFSCVNDEQMDDDYREFAHRCLDEWLNNSNGSGIFWLGDVGPDSVWKGVAEDAVELYKLEISKILREQRGE